MPGLVVELSTPELTGPLKIVDCGAIVPSARIPWQNVIVGENPYGEQTFAVELKNLLPGAPDTIDNLAVLENPLGIIAVLTDFVPMHPHLVLKRIQTVHVHNLVNPANSRPEFFHSMQFIVSDEPTDVIDGFITNYPVTSFSLPLPSDSQSPSGLNRRKKFMKSLNLSKYLSFITNRLSAHLLHQ